MIGPCAKRRVVCTIYDIDGDKHVGTNDCANAQPVCPRAPGEGYEKCKSVCQQGGHAEIEAIRVAGDKARFASAVLVGHYWMCEECGAALRKAGVHEVRIVLSNK